jgi:hypothetical protein
MRDTPKRDQMTKSQRSAIARKAAKSAWKTMNSASYQRAAKSGRKAVEKYLEKRAA